MASPGESDLCTSCGMCCDGTLFARATVAPGETPAITAAGLSIEIGEGGKTYFCLPCRFLDGACCTIYDSRFAICHSFACALLRRYRAGEVTLDTARGVVDEAQRLVAAAARDGGPRTRRERNIVLGGLANWHEIPDPDARASAGRRLVDLIALSQFLKRHFHAEDEPADAASA
jgi:hypothetical protein